ncbi:MAG: hypothetical protein RMH75_06080 [Archaeoglobaceae archaeon]|nr:hypothetical protein [Archaeoglobaceae archaeon]MDW7990213.1 hypothetical protein [Archaeoglobaceae archaeon]
MKRLGKGLDAILGEKSEVKTDTVKSDVVESDSVKSEKVLSIDEGVLRKAIEEGEKNPRVAVWSPKSSIVLRILKKTIPEFSISDEAAEILENGLRNKYPEVWEIVEKKMRD